MTTAHDLALLRLAAQRIVGPAWSTPAEAVGWLLAAQAQDLPGALTSVALRTTGRSVAEVVAAFDGGRVVRTWPMRGTLHAVRAEDVAWTVGLLASRPMASAAKRRVGLGLTEHHLHRARDLVTQALSGGRAMTRAEVLALWDGDGLPTTGGCGYHLLVHLAHEGLLCLGPMRGAARASLDQAFVLVAEWVPDARRLDRPEALAELASRYLRSHGPATLQDLARWGSLTMADARAGLGAAEPELETLVVDGRTYHLDPATPQILADHRDLARSVHLLPGFDEIVLGYADRSMTVPPEVADRIVPGGNGVFRPTVLADGVAIGTWRARKGVLETEPFTAFTPTVATAVAQRFAALPSSADGRTTDRGRTSTAG